MVRLDPGLPPGFILQAVPRYLFPVHSGMETSFSRRRSVLMMEGIPPAGLYSWRLSVPRVPTTSPYTLIPAHSYLQLGIILQANTGEHTFPVYFPMDSFLPTFPVAMFCSSDCVCCMSTSCCYFHCILLTFRYIRLPYHGVRYYYYCQIPLLILILVPVPYRQAWAGFHCILLPTTYPSTTMKPFRILGYYCSISLLKKTTTLLPSHLFISNCSFFAGDTLFCGIAFPWRKVRSFLFIPLGDFPNSFCYSFPVHGGEDICEHSYQLPTTDWSYSFDFLVCVLLVSTRPGRPPFLPYHVLLLLHFPPPYNLPQVVVYLDVHSFLLVPYRITHPPRISISILFPHRTAFVVVLRFYSSYKLLHYLFCLP